jgi:putative membrane protein
VVRRVAPYDRATWVMEFAPVLIALHALVLILGGAYTYARVPLGFWLQDALQLGRNPYDKIGHFM